MNRFLDAMKGLGGVLLLGGFLWLGVPRCSEVETLTSAERQQVTVLCRMVQARCFVEARPEMLSASEWRAVGRAWQSAQATEWRMLETRPETFENQTDAVLDRLAVRLRGR